LGLQKTEMRPLMTLGNIFAFWPGLIIFSAGMNVKRIYNVLVVDDSEDDRFFLRRAIGQFPRFKLLHELTDGQEAIDYLAGQRQFNQRQTYPLPDLMMLDLKMPRISGYEVLRWLRSQVFPGLTVIVLSGSALQEDVQASLALGAHGYWSKTAVPAKQRLIALEIEALLDGRSALRPLPLKY
jgi:CheY-like chemotaxis protein